ncbi:YigZ family protein [Sedimentibacter sp. MB31-C6]|uniref:YigZ family protein n=1 Tax=Sedimentibacter sp. MB31-C6 TaxID=3109366 RepID=UPI002DDCFE46|nr:YigZ family protein [Sedimentibacter sp. MB36-C1]WSI03967.1 YigZ family protein [Sedimentibacter sp. MB36-C1]
MSNYKSIHQYGRDEIIINKSKFIGTAIPINSEEEALEFINEIKKEYKDATHNVYAYTLEENMNIQRFSDDGEPSGTAGMPALNVITQENLRNVVVVVTRYFGGVMLGAGGLIRAYTKGAKIALNSGIIVDKNLFYEVSFKIDYTLLGKIDNELTTNNFLIIDKIYEESVILKLIVKDDDIVRLKNLLMELTSGQAEINIGKADYFSIKDGKVLK